MNDDLIIDDGRNEYVIHAKLKNNLILSRILEKFKNVRQFCEANKLSQTVVANFINMKTPAMITSRSWLGSPDTDVWSVPAKRLAEALMVHPSELFTEEQAHAELKSNEAYIEISKAQALSIVDPLKNIEQKQLLSSLFDAAELSVRSRAMLLLLADGATLDEVARIHNVTAERVRQIEAKALRHIRKVVKDRVDIVGCKDVPVLNKKN